MTAFDVTPDPITVCPITLRAPLHKFKASFGWATATQVERQALLMLRRVFKTG